MHAFTTPLVTKSDGTKFGKSEGGAVWLDPEMTSPYAFYQFWFNTDDRDIGRYLRYFSFRSHEELLALEKEIAERPAARAGQRTLAAELTALVHGAEVADDVIAASHALFGRGALDSLMPATLQAALAEAGLHRVHGELPRSPRCFATRGWWPASTRPGGRSPRGARTSTTSGWPTPRRRCPPALCCTGGSWCCGGASARSPA
ncbi:hypothetical protein Psuf_064740 [Phytohabitans suffuscus]|uniref:tyrosine--tRNA ligase n=1 Tax=Phytohabitans suffuscus TaxID=624315 RepID=A0A6F8YTK4_9ACTN|nr:hypothetical protein Psuf_064740 [Phytohabitans suffuscus]